MLEQLIRDIKLTVEMGGTVFVAGNGGSSATAEHFVNDLISRRIKAVCLNSNNAVVTMIANDYGYEYIFLKQLEVLAGRNDYLILISCSGTSKNILMAMLHQMSGFQLFGGEGTYENMENEHLKLLHAVAEGLGPKCL